MAQKPRNQTSNAKKKKDKGAPLVLKRPGGRSGAVRNRYRVPASEEIIINMIGDWKDTDTSTRHGVSVKNTDDPSLTLAEQMTIDLKNPVIECVICGKFIFKNGFTSHLRNSHPKPKGKPKRGKPRKGKQSKDRVSPPKPVLPNNNDPLENNELDGSKHVGNFRRQSDGKFGSFPLHDDYSDESNAD